MMRKRFLIIAFLAVGISMANGQSTIVRILNEIETNNLTLQARASLSEAEALEARVGNSLPDPEVEYEHVWGSPKELGKQGEFAATQSFDFPSAYVARNKLARLRGRQYSSEYALYRQEVLMEAQNLCLEIVALRKQRALLDMRAGFAGKLAGASERMLEEGQANVLQASEARVQYLAANNAVRLLDVEIADALGRLKILNGGVEIEFTDVDFPSVTGIMPFDDMAEIYYNSDPALAGALAERDAAAQEVKASRSESLPKFALGYKLEHGNGEQFHGVVAGMSIPMFGNRNNVKRARAQERYASLAADDARARTGQQLATLYAKAALLEKSIKDYAKITEDTGSYLGCLAKALEAGQISVTDYFSQYDGIIGFEEALIDLMREYHLVRAQIYSVML